jgi:hypothetical protein
MSRAKTTKKPAKKPAKKAPAKRRKNGPTATAAKKKYKRLHWGLTGRGKVARTTAPDPSKGTLVLLGDVVSIVYRTAKGADGLSEYEHEFSGPLPKLLVTPDGGLVIGGGSYRVTTRGIEG